LSQLSRNHAILLAGTLLFALSRLVPPPAGLSPEAWGVASVGALMALFWLTEALPLALTATLPFLLLPVMGLMSAGDIAGLYWSPIIFLVFGGALLAIAVEEYGLHRRLAIAIARIAPPSPRGLLTAFIAASAIVSMFVSNTATTLIMTPVALGLLAAVGEGDGSATGKGFAPALVLGVAYAASIGGLGTLVGSPTNAIAAGIAERSLGLEIDFLTWAAFGVPLVLIAIPLTALILILLFRVPSGQLDRAAVSHALGHQGPLGTDQKRLIPIFLLAVVGWVLLPLLQAPLGLPKIDDGIVAVGVALLLFVVPSEKGGALLTWRRHGPRVPWDILLLFGGGLALAGAITDSGLAGWIGVQLQALQGLELWALALVVVLVVVLVTEFASNVAAASAFMPVVAAVAVETGSAPLPLVMAAAFAASWGFMMPAGTGPNAIAFATDRVTIRQMVSAGALVDLMGVPLIVGISLMVAALI
jgi:sodium-dependent dicarboxylate transporter 2/3/5